MKRTLMIKTVDTAVQPCLRFSHWPDAAAKRPWTMRIRMLTVFVKQLKAGTYNTKNDKGVVEVPHFTEEDIPELC